MDSSGPPKINLHFHAGNINRRVSASHLGGSPAGSGRSHRHHDQGVHGAHADRADDGVGSRSVHTAAAGDEGDDPVRGNQQTAPVQK